MKFNLQFFSDGEVDSTAEVGAEEQTFAESEETVNDVAEGEAEAGAEEQPEVDMNAIYANARRKAEAEAKAKYDKEREALDAEYVRMFGNRVNPDTGLPIRSANDYLVAFQAQEQKRRQQELESKGVSTDLINELINNNPAVMQANALIIAQRERETQKLIDDDVAELGKLNPNIKEFKDIPKEVVNKCMQIQGLSLVDAYKMLNYDSYSSEREAAIRQGAINAAKGKQHLQPVNGVSAQEEGVDIPVEALPVWKKMYPDLSMSELRKNTIVKEFKKRRLKKWHFYSNVSTTVGS